MRFDSSPRARFLLMVLCSGLAMAGASPSVQIRDIEGRVLSPFKPTGKASVIVFVASDCPISNSYAPEIQRICGEYGAKGVTCALMYEDADIDVAAVRTHLDEYRYRGMTAVIDGDRTASRHTKASVTPQAVVVDSKGDIRYRGRINNFYAALGKPRQVVTVHDLRDALDAVLADKPVRTPETEALGCYVVPPTVARKEK